MRRLFGAAAFCFGFSLGGANSLINARPSVVFLTIYLGAIGGAALFLAVGIAIGEHKST